LWRKWLDFREKRYAALLDWNYCIKILIPKGFQKPEMGRSRRRAWRRGIAIASNCQSAIRGIGKLKLKKKCAPPATAAAPATADCRYWLLTTNDGELLATN
jgi:hypothetical protein